MTVDAPRAPATTFHRLRVAEVRRETTESVRVTLAVPDALAAVFRFRPGQYLTVRASVGGEALRRCYSICSPVGGPLTIGVKRIPEGRMSGLLHGLRAGAELEVLPPAGRFTLALDPKARRRYVGIAAGSGITPVFSLFRSVLEREPGSTFTLLYGNRSVDSIMFREDLEDLKDRFLTRAVLHHFLSRERTAVPLFHGRLDGDKCARLPALLGPLAAYDAFFLCGPAEMIGEVSKCLVEAGVDRRRVHTERFHNPGQSRTASPRREIEGAPVGGVTVTLRHGGVERTFPLAADAPSVLDGAHAAGLDLPFSCKAGVCCTCRAKLLEGEVEMLQNYSLEPWEVEEGYVLTCQAVPKTATLRLDLDQV